LFRALDSKFEISDSAEQGLRRQAGPMTIEEVEDREDHHEPKGSKAATEGTSRCQKKGEAA
jgi:hypothetical protein